MARRQFTKRYTAAEKAAYYAKKAKMAKMGGRRTTATGVQSTLAPYRPLADTKFVKLRVSSTGSFLVSSSTNPTSGLNYEYIRANSISNPFGTISSRQPLGHDQLQALFKAYIVIGSKVTYEVTPYPDSGGKMTQWKCGVYLDTDQNQIMDPNTLSEMPNGQVRTVTSNVGSPVKFTCTYSPRKTFGVKDPMSEQSTLGALFSGNPSRLALFHVWSAFQLGTYPAQMVYNVCIDYAVVCDQPVSLTAS